MILRRSWLPAVALAGFVALLGSLSTAPVLAQGNHSFRVMTFNIRMSTFDVGTPNAWVHRADLVAEAVREAKVSVVGFQEDMQDQVVDLRTRLKGWEFKGRGRNPNGSGERCSIAFDTSAWQCVESGDFWLSDTPDTAGSNTWGTKYPHKCTWARLESLKSHQQVLFTSTHLFEGTDAAGIEVRTKSAHCIRNWLTKHVPKGNIIACGDFNSNVDDPSHQIMTGASTGQQLQDAFDVLHPPEPSPGTCHEFTGVARKKRIDWILYAGKVVPQSLKIDHYSRDGHFPSDHFAVWTEFELGGDAPRPGKTAVPEPQVK
jgi:endonuclease/exonuclease/phosphatase family metal-dependent hydrolase